MYGSPNVRAFVKEILEVMTSADHERVKGFIRRLSQGVGEQLALKLTASFDAATAGDEQRSERTPRTPRTKGRARKKRRPRDRTT